MGTWESWLGQRIWATQAGEWSSWHLVRGKEEDEKEQEEEQEAEEEQEEQGEQGEQEEQAEEERSRASAGLVSCSRTCLEGDTRVEYIHGLLPLSLGVLVCHDVTVSPRAVASFMACRDACFCFGDTHTHTHTHTGT